VHAGPCVHVTALNPPAMFRNPAAPLLGTRNADCCQTPPRCRVGALDRARLTQRARPRRAARKLVAGGLATGHHCALRRLLPQQPQQAQARVLFRPGTLNLTRGPGSGTRAGRGVLFRHL